MAQLRGKRGPASAVSEEMLPRIRELHGDGHAAAHIARVLDIPVKALYPVMERLGLELTKHGRRSGVSPTQIKEMVFYYSQGEGTETIGGKYGVEAGTVARYLEAEGVVLRAPGFRHGANHHAWKDGRILTPQGYVLVLIRPDDPFFCMSVKKETDAHYVLEHRLVLARKFGRPLTEHETVHHIDGNKENNAIENLELRQGKHGKGVVHICVDCGSHNIVSTTLK